MAKKARTLSKFYLRFVLRVFRNISRSVQSLRANVNCRESASRQLHEISTVASNKQTRKKKRLKTTNRRDLDVTIVTRGCCIASIEIVRLIPGRILQCHVNMEVPLHKFLCAKR